MLGDAPKRIQLRRTKGWRLPDNAVSVARPTKWGNPYKLDEVPPKFPRSKVWNATEVVEAYRLMLAGGQLLDAPPGNIIVRAAVIELAGRDLACWCALDQPCHADVLLEYANLTQ